MKLQTLQILQILIECRNMVGGASVHMSKHSLFVSRSRSAARLACVQAFLCVCIVRGGVWYVVCVCWCVCVGVCGGVCVESVFGMCVLYFGVVVRFVCVSVMCGVGGWCVVCNVWCVVSRDMYYICGVVCCVCCVCGRCLARGKLPVCRFKTSPCAGSKRIRVYRQNARMLNTFARFARSHGGVLNLHTETF